MTPFIQPLMSSQQHHSNSIHDNNGRSFTPSQMSSQPHVVVADNNVIYQVPRTPSKVVEKHHPNISKSADVGTPHVQSSHHNNVGTPGHHGNMAATTGHQGNPAGDVIIKQQQIAIENQLMVILRDLHGERWVLKRCNRNQ